MKRTQIYLDEALDDELRGVAASEGRSAAALIRDAVADYLARRRGKATKDPLLALSGAFEGPPNMSTTVDQVLYGGPSGK